MKSATKNIGFFLESYLLFLESKAGGSHWVLDGSLTYLMLSNLQLEAYVGVNLWRSQEDWYVGTDISVLL